MPNISPIRQLIFEQTKPYQIKDLQDASWWLLGTQGCHLCEEAELMLRLFSNVYPLSIEKVDIANFDDKLIEQFASIIPVVLTPTEQLIYPFSIADFQRVYLT